MKKYSQSSLVDYILNILPELGEKIRNFENPNEKQAKTLFNIWKEQKNKVGNKVFNKPKEINSSDIDNLKNAGFVKEIGDKLQITQKGSEIIKTMILGDDRSAFDKSNKEIDLKTATANTKTPSCLKKKGNNIKNNWWSRF